MSQRVWPHKSPAIHTNNTSINVQNNNTMFVPTMTIQEAIAEALADLVSVQRKMARTIEEQERAHRKNRRGGDIIGQHSYCSPMKNNWLYVITTNKKQSFHNVLMWFYSKDGLHGLQLCSGGMHSLYTPHFLQRFRERSGHGDVHAEANLRAYFFRNPTPMIMETGKQHEGLPAILGSLPDGFVLGTAHEDEGYTRCRTFITHQQAFEFQKENGEALDALRELLQRYPAVYAQLQARAQMEQKNKAA